MILQNLSKAIREQNYYAVALEFVIVIAGVVIGFQINAWNEGRQEDALQSTTLDRLQADFTYLVEEIDGAIADHERNLEGLRAVRAALDAGRLEAEARSAFESGLIRAYIYIPPAGRSGTFVEIQASGRMGLIDEEGLRGALLIYDDNVRQAGEAFLHIRTLQNEYVADFTRRYSTPTGGERGPEVQYDFQAMVEDPAFSDAAEQLTSAQYFYLRWHEIHRAFAQAVLTALEAQE